MKEFDRPRLFKIEIVQIKNHSPSSPLRAFPILKFTFHHFTISFSLLIGLPAVVDEIIKVWDLSAGPHALLAARRVVRPQAQGVEGRHDRRVGRHGQLAAMVVWAGNLNSVRAGAVGEGTAASRPVRHLLVIQRRPGEKRRGMTRDSCREWKAKVDEHVQETPKNNLTTVLFITQVQNKPKNRKLEMNMWRRESETSHFFLVGT